MKKLILGLLLATSGLPVFAEEAGEPEAEPTRWVAGVSYFFLSEDHEDVDSRLNLAVISLGYRYIFENNLFVTPDIRIGKGVGNEGFTVKDTDVDVTVDNFVAISVRGQFEHTSGVYVFAAPSYANIGYNAPDTGVSYTKPAIEDGWEFGIGVGAGYRLAHNIAAEAMLEQLDGTDILSFSFKFDFW